jgi:3-dehydroquinate dehydratase / shikimate dehydrogenase
VNFVSPAKLCVTVMAQTTAELRRRRDEAVESAGADLVELRLDSVSDPDAAGALAGRRTPAIVTCRPSWEGGMFAGSEEERKRILAGALEHGAEHVDVEWRAGFHDLLSHTGGRRIVISSHDFDGVPPDLADRVAAMAASGAETVKVAVKARCLADCIPLLELSAHQDRRGRCVLLGMGDHGLATRVLAARFGSPWTYCGALNGIGQVTAQAMLGDFRFRSIAESTRLYGIVGGSVAHSVSPSMHNAAFGACGVDAVYLPLPATSADDFVAFGKAIGIAGASVTIPHKVSLFDRVDENYPAARRVGALNTIHVDNGRWIGDNTDGAGFLQPLQDRLALAGLRASVLGAGGAARAVADALAASHCRVTLHARRRAEAERVAALTSSAVGPFPPEEDSWDLLVNSTPIGMTPHVDATPVPKAQLTGRWVYDLVYNPPKTRLLREAAEMGCHTLGGLEMLVAQAQEQFRWWTGRRPPAGIMREAALKRLAECARDEHHVV